MATKLDCFAVARDDGQGLMPLDPDLLAILVCPLTRTPLRWDPDAGELVSDAGGLAYPVRNGVPVLIPELARRLDSYSRT